MELQRPHFGQNRKEATLWPPIQGTFGIFILFIFIKKQESSFTFVFVAL